MAEIDLIKNSSFEDKMDDVIDALSGISPNDGFTPTIVANKADGITTISITNKTGASTVQIKDGETGNISYANSAPTPVVDLTWISVIK